MSLPEYNLINVFINCYAINRKCIIVVSQICFKNLSYTEERFVYTFGLLSKVAWVNTTAFELV